MTTNTALEPLIRFITDYAPLHLTTRISGSTQINELASGGFAKAGLLETISRAGKGLSRDLLASITDMNDAAGWVASKWDGDVPVDLGKSTDDLVTPEPVTLRSVLPRDVELLYAAATDPRNGVRWRFRGETPGFDEFQHGIWNSQRCHYLVVSGKKPLAYVVAYNHNSRNRTAYLALLSLQAKPSAGLVFTGTFHFIEHAFKALDLRKLYVEVAEYNLEPVLGGAQNLFDIEGCLSDHELWQGQYWDHYIASASAASWETFASRWRHWFGIHRDPQIKLR